MPSVSGDTTGIIQAIMVQLPPLLVLMVALKAPKMLGTSATRAIASAGAMAGGAVTAVGVAAYNIV
jgi:hypothetical protein